VWTQYQISLKSEEKRILGRYRSRWEYDVKMELREI
jgi:hypothetical protein